MLSSEVEKLFRAFAEERKRALPQFTPDGILITLENKFGRIQSQKRCHTRIRNEQNAP